MTTSVFVTGGSGFVGGALVRRIDITRARTELGHAPVRTIDDGWRS